MQLIIPPVAKFTFYAIVLHKYIVNYALFMAKCNEQRNCKIIASNIKDGKVNVQKKEQRVSCSE
jgi:hypothetical protein